MMEQSNTNHALLSPADVRHRPQGNIPQQIGALFTMLGVIVLLLWFIE
jgi:hypothetical protein